MQYWPAPSCPGVARSERPAGSSPRAALSGVGWLPSGRQYPAHMTPAPLPPFHLAIPVHDIDAARHFYGEVLGFGRGRSAERWTDWNVEGHQVVTHQVDNHVNAVAGTNPVDGHDVPVPHFGLVLSVERFQELAQQLTAAGTDFVIEPYVRFQGEPGEQWTMFFLDPSGNALEFKAFQDPSQLFAVWCAEAPAKTLPTRPHRSTVPWRTWRPTSSGSAISGTPPCRLPSRPAPPGRGGRR